MKRISLFIAMLLLMTQATMARKTTDYKTVTDILYRDNPTADSYIDSLCRLDLYYPEGKTDFPTIIWFHGGSLTHGKRSIPETLKQKGFAIAGVDYRLTPRVTTADCIEDAAAAAAWVINNIASYGGDPSKIIVAGHSAGGYLTYMIGLDKRWMQPYGIDPDTAFKALIPYSGQVVTHFARRKELGIPSSTAVVDDMAPLNHVRPDCPPILMMTADRELEMLGRYEENAYFWRMMQIAGHPNVKLHELGGFKHGNMTQAGHYITVRYIRDLFKD